MPNNKKSTKNKSKRASRNLNNETIAALQRLSIALKDLNTNKNNNNKNNNVDTSISSLIPISINHYRDLPEEIEGAYKMLQEGSELIKAISTKYTLMGKISIEDGSKFSTEMRQGCELTSTAAFLVHQGSGCARPTKKFILQKSLAIVNAVKALVESFATGEALNGNIGARLTGAVWQVCDEVEKIPKGNRACMRRELFTWVRDCNETMQEFSDMIELGPLVDEIDNKENAEDDVFSSGEQYTVKELPVAVASLALIKCSRGILSLSLKACECASEALIKSEQNKDGSCIHELTAEEIDAAKQRKFIILHWINQLHELCRTIGNGATDLGCAMYPPLKLSKPTSEEEEEKDVNFDWSKTELGSQVLEQKESLLLAARIIHDATASSQLGDQERSYEIEMTDEVKEMCSKLLTAIEKRSDEVEKGINNALL